LMILIKEIVLFVEVVLKQFNINVQIANVTEIISAISAYP